MPAGGPPQPASQFDCSVVVATFNRSQGLRLLLESLARQTLSPDRFEAIVVDDGSTDDTQAALSSIVAPYRLKSLWQPNQGPAAARNAAIRAACGEIIVTVDDDVEPAPDLLQRHLEAHASGTPQAVFGRFATPSEKDPDLKPWTEWEFLGLERQYEAMMRCEWAPTPRQFYTANASVSRTSYLRAGLFDETFRRAEDVELAYRLRDIGLQFTFLPQAVIYHRPRRTFANWKSIAYQYGQYDVKMWRDKGRSHILDVVGHEFRNERPRSMQLLARVLVGRRIPLKAWLSLASVSALLAARLRARRVVQALYGAMFNLLYWQGITDALGGGRRRFLIVVGCNRVPVNLQSDPDAG
jgi:GT2 family glycosyltransferase